MTRLKQGGAGMTPVMVRNGTATNHSEALAEQVLGVPLKLATPFRTDATMVGQNAHKAKCVAKRRAQAKVARASRNRNRR